MKICLLCSERDFPLPQRSSISLGLFSHVADGDVLRKRRDLPSNKADILVISSSHIGDGAADAIKHEAEEMKARGVFLDAEAPPSSELATTLSQDGLFVFSPFAKALPKNVIPVVDAFVWGGSLSELFDGFASRFSRFAVSVNRKAYVLPLPMSSARPTELSWRELNALISRFEPDIFFSPQLYCKYFLYTSAHEVSLVLFVDAETISRKLRLAKKHGSSHAFLVKRNISDIFDEIF